MLLFIATGCHHEEYSHSAPNPTACKYAINDFGQEQGKKYGLKLLLVENVTDSTNTKYCMLFSSKKKIDLAEGRKIAAPLLRDFLQMLATHPEVHEYVTQAKTYTDADYEPKFTTIGFKIAFWDQDVNRPKRPYLAQILYTQEMFHYYEADATTQALRLVCTESYNDAVKNTKYQSINFNSHNTFK